MSLSCDCDTDFDTDYDWYYQRNTEFTPFNLKRRRRCYSCHTLIEIGADCLTFTRHRSPITEIEEKIYGDDFGAPLADWYYCEHCGELYIMLTDLGFCMDLEDNMNRLLLDYQKHYAHPSWRPPEQQNNKT